MAAPTVAGRAGGHPSGGANPVIGLVAGHSIGQMMLVVLGGNNDETPTWPAGWSSTTRLYDGTSDRALSVGMRIIDGTEPWYGSGTPTITVTWPVGPNDAVSVLLISSPPSIANVVISSGAASDSGGNPNPPQVTMPSSADTLFIACCVQSAGFSFGGTLTISAAPTNYSNLNGGVSENVGFGGTAVVVATAERTLTASSADPGTFTSNGSGTATWLALTIGLPPGVSFVDAAVAVAGSSSVSFAAATATILDRAFAVAGQSAVTFAAGTATYLNRAFAVAGQSVVTFVAETLDFINAAVEVAGQSAVTFVAGVVDLLAAPFVVAAQSTVSFVARLRAFFIDPRKFRRVIGIKDDPETGRRTIDTEEF